MEVYVLIQCSEDDKNIVCISKERDTLVAWLEREAENRRASKGVISCDVVWEDEGMAFLQGAFRYEPNSQVYDYFEEYIIDEHEVV